MALYNYKECLELRRHDYGFYSLIMAAMWKADTQNIEILKAAWPELFEELKARYNAPGGILPGDRVSPEPDDFIPDYRNEETPG